MSTQINQYLIYGVSLSKEWLNHDEGLNDTPFLERFEDYQGNNAFKDDLPNKDGLHICYDGMSGKFCIVGRVVAKSKDGDHIAERGPIEMDEPADSFDIKCNIYDTFGIEAHDAKLILVTKYS